VALDTIYQLVHEQAFGAEKIANVYYFNRFAGTGSALALALLFESEWLPLIQAVQSTDIDTTGLNVINLGDLADFTFVPEASAGLRTGDSLPIFNGVGFTFKPSTRAVRPGSKRIAGLSESDTTRGRITNGGELTAIENLRLAYESDLTGGTDGFEPVIVKRVKTPVVGTVPLQYTYRLPRTDAELVFGTVLAVLSSPVITHQVSRGELGV
jgi:hypothetical protein